MVGSGRRVQNGQRLVKLRQGRRNSLPSNCLVAYNEYVKTFVSLCQRLVSGNYKHFFPTCVNVRQDVWKITGDTGLFFFVWDCPCACRDIEQTWSQPQKAWGNPIKVAARTPIVFPTCPPREQLCTFTSHSSKKIDSLLTPTRVKKQNMANTPTKPPSARPKRGPLPSPLRARGSLAGLLS